MGAFLGHCMGRCDFFDDRCGDDPVATFARRAKWGRGADTKQSQPYLQSLLVPYYASSREVATRSWLPTVLFRQICSSPNAPHAPPSLA